MTYSIKLTIFFLSKGVTAFDNETGFWIISSVPRFPTVASEGYQFMANQTRFGQTILCITFRSENVKKEISMFFLIYIFYFFFLVEINQKSII